MAGVNTENLVAELESLIDEEQFKSIFSILQSNKVFIKINEKSEGLALRFVRAKILESLCDKGTIDELLWPSTFESKQSLAVLGIEIIKSEGFSKLSLELNSTESVLVDEIEQVISYIALMKLEVAMSSHRDLIKMFENWEVDSGYTYKDFQSAKLVDKEFVPKMKRWLIATLQHEYTSYLLGEEVSLNADEESFYAGGASYTISNLNVVSPEQLANPCKLCGHTLMVCQSDRCLRNYYFARTGIDCSVDAIGILREIDDDESVEQIDSILFSVSELGSNIFELILGRIPIIKGTLKLYKNELDGQVRILIGNSFFIDYEDYLIEDSDEEFENLESQVNFITHPDLIADEYLVVFWKTPFETGDESCFILGLYRGKARQMFEACLGYDQNESNIF